MSSNTITRPPPFVAYMPCGRWGDSALIYISRDEYVQDLEDSIRQNRNFKLLLKDEEPVLLKCTDLLILSESKLKLEWLHNNAGSEPLDKSLRISHYFPTGPTPRLEQKIDILVVTDSILESQKLLYTFPKRHACKVAKDRLSLIDKINDFSSPLEVVSSEEKINSWVNRNTGVHAHRPTGNYGPPTTLFHPAFARLSHHLKNLDEIEEPSSEYLEWSHKFIVECCDGFKRAWLGEGDLRHIINTLIGEDGRCQLPLEDGVVTPDAIWGTMIRAILELKDINGVDGNATLQCCLDFAKILTHPEYQKHVARSNFPVILIGLMGSRLEISTAIFTDGIYTDKLLSEEFFIDAWQSVTVLRVGRIFKALSLAIAELRDYYQNLSDNPNTEVTTAYMYPDPLPIDLRTRIPRLDYHGKLLLNGELLQGIAVDRHSPYAIYRAKMYQDKLGDEVEVVVKFTVHYNEEAHRILAKSQLAPTLHFCIPLIGGMHMVIMDYIESAPLPFTFGFDHQAVYSDVETAIKLLHDQDLVFGDLRVQNVLLKPGGGAMLIDFDWVGKHRVDRYPASWNSDNVEVPGVDRMALMEKAHDLFLLKELQKHAEYLAVE